MSEPNQPVAKSGAATRSPGYSASFHFDGAVLQPGESGEERRRKNRRAEFRKQAIVSLGISVGLGLAFVLSGLGSLLVSDLRHAYCYTISERFQFLCSTYIFWSGLLRFQGIGESFRVGPTDRCYGRARQVTALPPIAPVD